MQCARCLKWRRLFHCFERKKMLVGRELAEYCSPFFNISNLVNISGIIFVYEINTSRDTIRKRKYRDQFYNICIYMPFKCIERWKPASQPHSYSTQKLAKDISHSKLFVATQSPFSFKIVMNFCAKIISAVRWRCTSQRTGYAAGYVMRNKQEFLFREGMGAMVGGTRRILQRNNEMVNKFECIKSCLNSFISRGA